MTECGDPKENAIAERIKSTLKNEILDKRRFESFEDLERARECLKFCVCPKFISLEPR